MAKMMETLKLKVKVDTDMVKFKTKQVLNGIAVITETVAHKDCIVEMHKQNVKIS